MIASFMRMIHSALGWRLAWRSTQRPKGGIAVETDRGELEDVSTAV
jgi:hypothetical protein